MDLASGIVPDLLKQQNAFIFSFLIFLAGLEIDVNKIINSFPGFRIRMIDVVSNSLLLAIFIYVGALVILTGILRVEPEKASSGEGYTGR